MANDKLLDYMNFTFILNSMSNNDIFLQIKTANNLFIIYYLLFIIYY